MARGNASNSAPAADDADSTAAPDLEAGIAAVFAVLRAAGEGDGADTPSEPPVDSGATFELLGELDRLWRNDA
jgi:hypothetical protein